MKALILLSSLFALSAQAALPPYYHTAREIRAILDSAEVHAQLGSGRAISSITRQSGGYQVVAGECTLFVETRYSEPPFPGYAGPGHLELIVGRASCLPR